MRWPGVYGFGFVLCILGLIWLPEHTRQWINSGLVMLAAAVFAMSVRPKTDEEMEQQPELLYKGGPDGG